MAVQMSVIVPLGGGPEQALRCFEGLAAQTDAPPHEVIVVDDASVGLDHLLARLDGDVRVVRTGTRVGFAAAAQVGASHARAETIALVRRAAAPTAGWLRALWAGLADPAVGMVASATSEGGARHPLEAWAVAVSTRSLLERTFPELEERLVFGALAVACAERGQRIVSVPDSVVSAPADGTGWATRRPGEAPCVTIVIPTLDAASERLRRCVEAIRSATEAAHEIVLIDNGSAPQGFSAPVNAGLRSSRAPYVVVMNDDVEPLPGWWPPLRAALDAGAAVAFPHTVEGPMRTDFAAWCFAANRAALADFAHAPDEFFDPSMVIWYQDTDLLHRLRVAGRPPVLVPESKIRHGLSQTVRTEDPELAAWIYEQVSRDRERFIAKHPDARLVGHALAA